MSLETIIASLVTAANNLTNAVSGKIGQIDARMDKARAEFDQYRSLKDVVGSPDKPGTLNMSVFQGTVWSTGGQFDVGSTGDFTATNLGDSTNVYLHFKLPFNVNNNDAMFWLNIKGYNYGSSKIIEETFVGYCFAPQRAVINKSCFGNLTPAIYSDTNGNVVCSLKFDNIYVSTIRVDTMKVGQYKEIKLGELVSKLSLSPTVVF